VRFYRYEDLAPNGAPGTRKHINDLEARGEFPKRVWLGPNTIAWVADEVDALVETKVRARDEGGGMPEFKREQVATAVEGMRRAREKRGPGRPRAPFCPHCNRPMWKHVRERLAKQAAAAEAAE
jgi:prophage regulatory protein